MRRHMRRPTRTTRSRRSHDTSGVLSSAFWVFFVFLVSAPREYHYLEGVIFVLFFRYRLFIMANYENVSVFF